MTRSWVTPQTTLQELADHYNIDVNLAMAAADGILNSWRMTVDAEAGDGPPYLDIVRAVVPVLEGQTIVTEERQAVFGFITLNQQQAQRLDADLDSWRMIARFITGKL